MPVLKVKKDGEWVDVFGGSNTPNGVLPIPSPTVADEGAFLRVVNKEPVWVTIPRAEEATF